MKISIVITCYNREKTISRAIMSILNQTYKDFDIIVVDDGSEDSSVDKIKKEFKDKVKLYELKKNKGAAYAKNYGVKKVNSKYFLFLDSDDELSSEKTLELINKLLLNNPDLIVATERKIIRNNKIVIEKFKKIENVKEELLKFPFNYIGGSPFVYNKDLYLQAKGLDTNLKWGEGLSHIRRYVNRVPTLFKIEYLEGSFYNYYLEGNNISKKNKNFNEIYKLVRKSFYENKKNIKENDFFLRNWTFILFYINLKNKSKYKALIYLKKIFFLSLKKPKVSLESFFYIFMKWVVKYV